MACKGWMNRDHDKRDMHVLKGQRETVKDVTMWCSEMYAKPEHESHLRHGTHM
jgi:hypothetical protein